MKPLYLLKNSRPFVSPENFGRPKDDKRTTSGKCYYMNLNFTIVSCKYLPIFESKYYQS